METFGGHFDFLETKKKKKKKKMIWYITPTWITKLPSNACIYQHPNHGKELDINPICTCSARCLQFYLVLSLVPHRHCLAKISFLKDKFTFTFNESWWIFFLKHVNLYKFFKFSIFYASYLKYVIKGICIRQLKQ